MRMQSSSHICIPLVGCSSTAPGSERLRVACRWLATLLVAWGLLETKTGHRGRAKVPEFGGVFSCTGWEEVSPWMMILVQFCHVHIFNGVAYEQSSCIINHQYIINISSNLHQPVFIGILRACRVDAVRPRQVLAERAAFLDGSKAKVGRCFFRMGQDGEPLDPETNK